MNPNVKKNTIQGIVLLANLALVGTGAAYIKNQQDEKTASRELANDAAGIVPIETVDVIDPVAEKAAQLQQIIENTATQKRDSVANNTGQVTVQKPKTITQTIPGGTRTVTSSTPSSSASVKTTAKATPAKTTSSTKK